MKSKIFFSNSEILNIFKSNKRILLFIIEEQIVNIDKCIAERTIAKKKTILSRFNQYFSQEIEKAVSNQSLNVEKVPTNFNELRKIGENESEICKLIREDLVKDFIVYINRNNIPINSIINHSIYETNTFLIDQDKIKLIEYAAFFGSMQVFNYLKINEAELTPSIWLYAIHSQNAELIKTLEDILPLDESMYEDIIKESIKCHHNDIANYFLNNYIEKDEVMSQKIFNQSLEYYNFEFIQINFINESLFFNLCKYDYYIIVEFLLKNQNIDINKKIDDVILFFK